MLIFFFFNDTATTEIYTLSLHDALPILSQKREHPTSLACGTPFARLASRSATRIGNSAYGRRSEEHTSELQSRQYLVCRLLLEKKKTYTNSVQHCSKQQLSETTSIQFKI